MKNLQNQAFLKAIVANRSVQEQLWSLLLDQAMQRPCLSITDVCRVVEHFGLKSSLTRSKGELETE
eukprot:1061575-Amphidinium_carterae.1